MRSACSPDWPGPAGKQRATSRKHLVLLVALVGMLVAQPALVHRSAMVVDLSRSAFGLMYIYVFFIVFDPGWERRVASVLFLPVVMSAVAHFMASYRSVPLEIAFHCTAMVFVAFAVNVILRDLFRASVIRGDDVLGAVCGYILAGLVWGHLYTMVYLLKPEAFSVSATIAPQLADFALRHTLFDYLSFTTLTSIGYADITPAGPPVYSLTWLEVMFGQFYMAVVVAQLVGLKLAQAVRRGTE
jgi:hypothetical protein